MLKQADQILYRRLTWSDFDAMHGGFASGSGGGAKHISLSTSMRAEIADFFDVEDPGEDGEATYAIEVEPIEGISDSDGPIKVSYEVRGSEGRTEWRIRDQHRNRYVLWDDPWFPGTGEWDDKEEYRADGTTPLIYFIKDTDAEFHARALSRSTEENLQKFPAVIRNEWHDAIESYYQRDNCAIINLIKGMGE